MFLSLVLWGGGSLYPSIFVWIGFSGCYQKDSWTFHRVPPYAIKIMEFSQQKCQSQDQIVVVFLQSMVVLFPILKVKNGIHPLLVSFTTMSFFSTSLIGGRVIKSGASGRSFTLYSTSSINEETDIENYHQQEGMLSLIKVSGVRKE